MKTHPSSNRRLIGVLHAALLVLPLLALSCEQPDPYPDNRWWTANTFNEPGTITKDGVLWIPRKSTSEVWYYYPKQVLAFLDEMTYEKAGFIDSAVLMVNGRRWKFTADNRQWSITPPWEPSKEDRAADTQQNWTYALYLIIGVCAIAAVIAMYQIGLHEGETKTKDAAQTNATRGVEGMLSELEDRERRHSAATAHHARVQAAAEQSVAEQTANLKRREAEAEERNRCLMLAVKNAEAMLQKPGGVSGTAAIGRYLRERHVQGAAIGDLMTATFLADRSGFVRLAWSVQVERPQPPMVRIVRDGKVIRTDLSFAGEHGDHVIPGRRYLYEIGLQDDRGHLLGQGLKLELKIPTARTWDDLSGGEGEDDAEIRRKFMSRFNGLRVAQEMRQECYADVKSKKYPSDIEEWFLASIDALAAQLCGGSGQ